MRRTTATLLFLAAAPVFAQDRPVLTVLTYDSFVSEWGPGPLIEPVFEAECGCDLRFVAGGDGAALLARLRLEGDGTEADVVLGLDANLVAQARAMGLFAPHGLSPELDLPVEWSDDTFLPFDWGWFSVVGRADGPRPRSFQELAESDAALVLQDPRSSTPGLGLVLWVEAAYGEEAPAVWEALADNIVTSGDQWLTNMSTDDLRSYLSLSSSAVEESVAEEDAAEFEAAQEAD